MSKTVQAGSKTGAVIQARLNSSRLPGKALADILGRPLIVRLVEQISYARRLDEIIVATSTEPSDDPLCEACDRFGIDFMRGDLNNVLERYIRAADSRELDVVIRITGDNPLTDPFLIDDLVDAYEKEPVTDYINNVHRDGSVHGTGSELVTSAALKNAREYIREENDPAAFQEHVTLYIRQNTDVFNTKKYHPPKGLSRPDVSCSVDHPEDLELVRMLFSALYQDGNPIRTNQILEYLDKHPNLLKINSHLHGGLPAF